LRKRGEQWRIRFTTEKYDIEDELPIVMPELVAVIKEQQSYIKQQFGESYDKLFCGSLSGKQYSRRNTDVAMIQKLVFYPKPETMSWGSFSHLLNTLAQMCDIRTREGKLWRFRSHQFRRTVATVMTNAGVRDLIIQKYLRHRSPRMLLHYQHFLKQAMQSEYEELLREKKYVDISGELVTNHKPNNPLTELMRRKLYQITT
jgi:integrase